MTDCRTVGRCYNQMMLPDTLLQGLGIIFMIFQVPAKK